MRLSPATSHPPASRARWREYARIPMPPDHPAAKAWRQPGEVMYPGLGAIDWQRYLETIQLPGRRDRIREAMRTLILTNRRLIVVDEAQMQKTDLPLRDVEDVSVDVPPGKPIGLGEARVQVVFRAGSERRAVGWATRKADAEVFAEMIRELARAGG